jgi:hypothetical protein
MHARTVGDGKGNPEERIVMTASIYWKPSKNGGSALDVAAPSAFMDNIKAVFGDFPITLNDEDITKLEVLAAINKDAAGNPYEELIEAIHKSGTVEVWAVF